MSNFLFCTAAVLLAMSTLTLHAAPIDGCKEPSWAERAKVSRIGSSITIACSGQGPTQTIAEFESKAACDSMAANEFFSDVEVQDLVVIQGHDTVLNREVISRSCVRGLVCSNLKTESCGRNGVFVSHRMCTYDLAKASVALPDDCMTGKPNPSDSVIDPNLATIKKRTSYPVETSFLSDNYVLTISSTPPCADLLVVAGHTSRRISCTSNPMRLPIKTGDVSVLVRAKGFLPKTIDLKKYNDDGQVMVFLDQSN
ncbi:MAG TPA: hypothetical protein V6C65_28975 [Allocoleopsis sp.]